MPERLIDFSLVQLTRLERDAQSAQITVSALVKRIVDRHYAGEDRISGQDFMARTGGPGGRMVPAAPVLETDRKRPC